jgi:hypothetical protein
MIKKVLSLVKAEQVLLAVQNSDAADKIDCLVESYQNGREQGLMLWNSTEVPYLNTTGWLKAIYIAQERRSDSIVVYVGEYSMQSISENAYKNGKTFSSVEAAAEYVEEVALVIFGKDGKRHGSSEFCGIIPHCT